MELDICKGDWGLASVQLNSLKVAAYVKFLGAPVKFQEKTNPILTPNGTFPVFRHGKHVLDTFENITDYLKTHNFNADINLTPDQEANALAFAQYLDHKLFPCLQYIWWVDATNSGQEIKTWYSKNIPFPFNYYYPGKFEQAAKDLMESLYGEDYDTKDVHYDVYQTAEKCFGDLSAKLGEKEFFFGSHPCSLDAHVFAYIALILKIPQRNATLLNTLKTHSNLVQFASRISQRYFVAINNEFTGKITNKKAEATTEEEGKTSSQRNRDKIFAVVFASIAMTCYAISKGILQINLKEEFQNSIDYKDFFDAEEDD